MHNKAIHNGADHLIAITRFLLIVLFVYTATSKLIAHQQFQGVLSKSPWLNSVAPVISYLLPVTELVIAVLLVIPVTVYTGLYMALFLLIFLTIYLLLMVAFAPTLPCACGGVIGSLGWKSHIFFNLFFTCITIIAIWKSPTGSKPKT